MYVWMYFPYHSACYTYTYVRDQVHTHHTILLMCAVALVAS